MGQALEAQWGREMDGRDTRLEIPGRKMSVEVGWRVRVVELELEAGGGFE